MMKRVSITYSLDAIKEAMKIPHDCTIVVFNPHEDYHDITNPREIEFSWDEETEK